MMIETSILAIGRSQYVRIPASMVKFFEIDKTRDPKKCKIEDTGQHTAELTFEMW